VRPERVTLARVPPERVSLAPERPERVAPGPWTYAGPTTSTPTLAKPKQEQTIDAT
jgi:hypothetical protein